MIERKKHGKEITLEELKVLQMDILDAIDEFCCKNGIRYSLACGSLLGAIRHKGYIPWDDDIDIYVPREDYEKLVNIFPENYKGRYKIASLERDSLWDKPYAKGYDNYTEWEEDAEKKENIGVNIDIFPVDEVPSGEEWTKYNKNRRREQILFSMKFIHVSPQRSLFKNLTLILFRVITFFYSTRAWAKRIDKQAQRFNGKGYDHYFECCQGIFQKNPFPMHLFDEIVETPFEDRFYKRFANADIYLRNGFGDYMKLPPKEKRVSHHAFKAFWK